MKETKLLLSLAVHENVDAIVDQIKNIKKYIPNSYLILHCSHNLLHEYKNEIYNCVSKFDNVYINPQSLHTNYLDGTVLLAHLINLQYAESIQLEYSYLLLLGSNEMYVRSGVEQYIKSFESSDGWQRAENEQFDDGFSRALNDPYLSLILRKNNLTLKKRAPEGTFYSNLQIQKSPFLSFIKSYNFKLLLLFYSNKPLAKLRVSTLTPMARLLNKLKVFNFLSPLGYATEEFYLPSFFIGHSKVTKPVCYMDWDNNLNISIEKINLIRDGMCEGKFSVKRVNRNMDDPIRIYINKL
ncbi:hypothetical protein AB7254_07395 [Providencia rettgeri]|uniref:hypothetical protein n=1 Tax=Providencia sp. PROV092 TaxID=2949808 RepID=UPI00234BC3BE|nr:hypothetical protein [Providencia sp. PROV092]